MSAAQRRDRWIAAVLLLYAAAAPAVTGAIILSNRASLRAAGLTFGSALLWQGILYFTWAALGPLVWWLGRRFRLRTNSWLAPLPAYLVGGIVIVALHSVLSAWLDWFMDPTMRSAFADAFPQLLARRLPIESLIYFAIVGVVYAVEYSTRLREREETAAEVERELVRAQLQSLKMQLQPHFLFNALQALAVLIRHEPEKAVKMTVLLGDMLRTTLSRATSQLVPLRDELQLIEQYLAIEQIRFGEDLIVTFDVDSAAVDCMVPDLVLQPLVENAIKHGLAPVSGLRKLAIKAFVDGRLHLQVIDSGVGMHNARRTVGSGVGLSTTRQRLEALYGADFMFEIRSPGPRQGTIAEITIPAR